jgi:hypothetical protein
MPSSAVSPTIGSSEKVTGRTMAMATAAPTPGSPPTITPPIEPISSAAMTSQRAMRSILDESSSMTPQK